MRANGLLWFSGWPGMIFLKPLACAFCPNAALSIESGLAAGMFERACAFDPQDQDPPELKETPTLGLGNDPVLFRHELSGCGAGAA
ncbi:hypothetical protein [Jannaschia seosinensis]|uniref:hypothetical protein n=1 Tax=Jannaschia seosinensis TaxID=313367 RepID=UPI0011874863|nr:hypothetical protein [Jannaschia seosinensis]